MSQVREGREWFIELEEFEDEDGFRDAVAQELARLENMGHRLGRGFVVTPIRRPRDLGGTVVYDTIAWCFSETFMPAVKPRTRPEELTAEEMAEHFPEPEPASA